LQGKFVLINEAYTVLSDKDQRSKFDSKHGQSYTPPQGPYSNHHSAHQNQHQHWAYRESAHKGWWWERSNFDGAWYASNSAQRSSRANRASWSSRPSHTDRELVHKAVAREVRTPSTPGTRRSPAAAHRCDTTGCAPVRGETEQRPAVARRSAPPPRASRALATVRAPLVKRFDHWSNER
jgi:DnaJ-class molecular chaperone